MVARGNEFVDTRGSGTTARGAPCCSQGKGTVFVPLAAIAALPNLLQNGAVPLDRPLGRTAASDAGMQLLAFILGTLVQAMVVFAAFQDMRGRRVRIGESLKRGLARTLPVIVASIGMGVAIGLGLVLLVVPDSSLRRCST